MADSVFAEQIYTVNTNDYGFAYNGTSYGADVIDKGVINSYTDSHCNDCYDYGAVDSDTFRNGKRIYDSTVYFTYNNSSRFNYEIGIDLIRASTVDGSSRFLTDGEYNFTSVTIPSLSTVKNINGFPLENKSYTARVYVRRAGEAGFLMGLSLSLEPQVVW